MGVVVSLLIVCAGFLWFILCEKKYPCPTCKVKCNVTEGAMGETHYLCDKCDKEHAKAEAQKQLLKADNETALHYGNTRAHAKEKALAIAKNDSKHGISAYRVPHPATSEDFIQLVNRFVKEEINGLSFGSNGRVVSRRKLTDVLKQRRGRNG